MGVCFLFAGLVSCLHSKRGQERTGELHEDCKDWKRLQERVRFAQPKFWVVFLAGKGPDTGPRCNVWG